MDGYPFMDSAGFAGLNVAFTHLYISWRIQVLRNMLKTACSSITLAKSKVNGVSEPSEVKINQIYLNLMLESGHMNCFVGKIL